MNSERDVRLLTRAKWFGVLLPILGICLGAQLLAVRGEHRVQVLRARLLLALEEELDIDRRLLAGRLEGVERVHDGRDIHAGAEQHDDLLGQIQVVSSDFNGDTPVMKDGKVMQFLGINFIHTERLPTSSSHRRCPVWVPSGVHLGMWNDIMSDITQRRDLSSHPYQIYLMGTFGATRTEEKKVVDILCAE